MAVALTVVGRRETRRQIEYVYSAAFSGNYVTGGDTLDFTAATRTFGDRVPAGAPEILEIIGNPGGNAAVPVIGAAANNSKIKLFSAANTEVAAAGYNAAVTAETNVKVRAIFRKGKI